MRLKTSAPISSPGCSRAMILPFKKKKPHKTREGKIALTLKAHAIDTVIDIGANNGQTRDYLRFGGYEGDIISVEPLPALQRTLQNKAKRDPCWSVLPPLAIGDHDGTCLMNVSEASDMSSALPSSSALMSALPKTRVVEQVEVPMKTLDTLLSDLNLEGRNVFVKMDTQGYEMRILENAPMALPALKGLQLELSLFELYEGETLYDDIIAFLKTRGFHAHMIVENNFSRKLNRQLQVDGIFYKD